MGALKALGGLLPPLAATVFLALPVLRDSDLPTAGAFVLVAWPWVALFTLAAVLAPAPIWRFALARARLVAALATGSIVFAPLAIFFNRVLAASIFDVVTLVATGSCLLLAIVCSGLVYGRLARSAASASAILGISLATAAGLGACLGVTFPLHFLPGARILVLVTLVAGALASACLAPRPAGRARGVLAAGIVLGALALPTWPLPARRALLGPLLAHETARLSAGAWLRARARAAVPLPCHERALPRQASLSPDAPDVVVLATLDALRCGQGGPIEGDSFRRACPELSRLGREGAMQLAHAAAPETSGSVRAIASGCVGPCEGPTLTRVLHDLGYRTSAIFQHRKLLGDPLVMAAFDEVDGSLASLAAVSTVTSADEVTARTLRRIDRRAHGERLFLWIHHFDAHDPYVLAPGRQYRGSTRQAFDAEVGRVDRAMGQLVEGIRRRGLRALVIASPDHGEHFGEHHRERHGSSLYGEVARVPLLAWSSTPRELGPLPTALVELSRWLVARLAAQPFTPASEHFLSGGFPPVRALVSGSWKLIEHAPGVVELFDLGADPFERDDRSQDPAAPAAALLERLDCYVAGLER